MKRMGLMILHRAGRPLAWLRACAVAWRQGVSPAARHDQANANDGTVSPHPPAVSTDRTRLRLRSLTWALLAALAAAAVSLAVVAPPPWAAGASGTALDSALRAAGCGFFYGLLEIGRAHV